MSKREDDLENIEAACSGSRALRVKIAYDRDYNTIVRVALFVGPDGIVRYEHGKALDIEYADGRDNEAGGTQEESGEATDR